MSLTLTLNNALSALKVNQQTIAVISQNIANANNENYSRQEVTQSAVSLGGAIGAGVQIESISRKVSDFLIKSIREHSSDVSRVSVISDYWDQLQSYMGKPGGSNSIDTYVDDFFKAVSQLATTPERTSMKYGAVTAGKTLADEISGLARHIEDMRFQADQDIKQTVDGLNNDLTKLKDVNQAILSAEVLGQSKTSLFDQRDKLLKQISDKVNITTLFKADGSVTVLAGTGVPLLDPSRYQISYTSALSVDDFINNTAMNPITVAEVGGDGSVSTTTQELVSGGVESAITTNLTGGKLKGLMELRDVTLPDILSQLDMLGSTLRDQVNIIHNEGTAYPPPSSLTGTRLVNPTDSNYWNGQVRIGALTSDGTPAGALYNDETGVKPLLLDLSTLDGGNGAGQPTIQSIINEINGYYGPPQQKVTVSNLNNIQLAAIDNSLTAGAGNTFNFNFDLDNISANPATFRVTNVSSTGGVVVTVPAAFPSSDFTVPAGSKLRTGTNGATGISVRLDMAAAGAGPYTITVSVEVDDPATGLPVAATMTYSLSQATAGLRNDRYSVVGTTTPATATLVAPNTSQRVMTAKLVDANGNEVSKSAATGEYTAAGYLQLVGNGTFISVDSLNSAENGAVSGTTTTAATGRGFSHYFELNNFFNKQDALEDSAINLSVKSTILSNPALVSLGKMTLSRQPSDPNDPPLYTYELGSGNQSIASKLADLSNSRIAFTASGGISGISLNFHDYAAEILGFNSAKASDAKDVVDQEKLLLKGFQDKEMSVSGVNVDEELANTVLFQNSYAAAARLINATKEMFDSLLNTIGR